MRSSYHYNLNLVEGSDLVNPLVQDVPNYEAIDNQMYDNAVASIGLATELKSGTVHALTRTNPDAPMFRFVATSRYDEGDTFTVDGIQVSGLLTDGTTPSDGAYAINANVLCCLAGSVLTLYTVSGEIQTAQNALKLGGELPSYYGTASDVQNAVNTANSAGLLANAMRAELTQLQTLNFDNTSLPSSTTFTEVVQKLMDKVFAKIATVVTFVSSTAGVGSNKYFAPTTYDNAYFSLGTNNTLTCKISGTYKLSCTSMSGADYMYTFKNGVEIQRAQPHVGTTLVFDMNVGDTLSIQNPAGNNSSTVSGTLVYDPT